MTATLPDHTRDVFALEPGGWLTVHRAMPELNDLAGLALLERTQVELCRHVRYARAATGVVLVAEDHLGDDENGMGRARGRLLAWLDGAPDNGGEIPESHLIESALADLTAGTNEMTWSEREGRLIVPAGNFSPVELEVRGISGGLQVEGRLALLDNAGDVVRAALGEYLTRGQLALRFARLELDATSARVVSQATTEALDVELPLVFAGVAAGCRRLNREVAALARLEVAEIYLRCVARDALRTADRL